MRKHVKQLTALIMVLCIAFGLIACGGSSKPAPAASEAPTAPAATKAPAATEAPAVEPIVLKFAHTDPPTSTDGRMVVKLGELIEERSGGRLKLEIYDSGVLGDNSAMHESTQLGTLDITISPDNTYSNYAPNLFGISSVPYLFTDNNAFMDLVVGTGIAAQQAEILKQNNMIVLNTDRNLFKGPYRLICAQKPIETLDDLQGLRMRVFENKTYIEAYKRIGCNPLVVPWSEVYSSLKQGLVEATTANFSQVRGCAFPEICPYIIRNNEYYSNNVIVMNKDKYDSLGSELQQILHDCCNEIHTTFEQMQADDMNDDIEFMKKEWNAEFSELDTEPIRQLLRPFYEELEAAGTLPAGTVAYAFGEK